VILLVGEQVYLVSLICPSNEENFLRVGMMSFIPLTPAKYIVTYDTEDAQKSVFVDDGTVLTIEIICVFSI